MEAKNKPAGIATQPGEVDELLETIRSILLDQDRARLQALDERLKEIQKAAKTGDEELLARIEALLVEIEALQAREQAIEAEVDRVQEEIQPAVMAGSLTPEMSNLIRRTIHDSHDEMAEAIGPVMGEAMRVQIRDSRKDMVEALYPVIGESVQRAIAEFAREFQRNIDSRLKGGLGPQSAIRRMSARLRGVTGAELALRDALPFRIREIFLIQHGSGLLIAHSSLGEVDDGDSDLVGAMLTAIRDFVRDSFGRGAETEQELDAIDYGDLHIQVQNDKYAYLAVVYEGVEPEGFRAATRTFLSELHVRFGSALRDYVGDPAILPNFDPQLETYARELESDRESDELTPGLRRFYIGAAIFLVLFLIVSCFYLRFTIALWPVAFPGPSETPTQTVTPSATATHSATPTATETITPSPTSTPSPTPTQTPTATATHTLTYTPTATNTPVPTDARVYGVATGDVWVRVAPDENAMNVGVIRRGDVVEVLAVDSNWAKIPWQIATGAIEGWVSATWLSFPEGFPDWLVTPVP